MLKQWQSKEEFLWRNYIKVKILKKMATIKVTKVKSAINRTKNQKRTLEALGLKKIGQTVEHQDTPNILGMIKKVNHLVSVETK
ncbi:MAG: 50S ribosomal protein L30 [Flavobacteriaceae bacterium]|nr:50S ribosomal protein L30 [Flavobacteriaceae bacterium]